MDTRLSPTTARRRHCGRAILVIASLALTAIATPAHADQTSLDVDGSSIQATTLDYRDGTVMLRVSGATAPGTGSPYGLTAWFVSGDDDDVDTAFATLADDGGTATLSCAGAPVAVSVQRGAGVATYSFAASRCGSPDQVAVSVVIRLGGDTIAFAPEDSSIDDPAFSDFVENTLATTTSVRLPKQPVAYGTAAQINVSVSGEASGIAVVKEGAKKLVEVDVEDGDGQEVLPKTLGVGVHPLTVTFVPDDDAYLGSTATASLRVAKADTATRLTLAKKTVTAAALKSKGIVITLKTTPKLAGKAVISVDGAKKATVTVKAGKAVYRLKTKLSVKAHAITAQFRPSGKNYSASTTTPARLTVKK